MTETIETSVVNQPPVVCRPWCEYQDGHRDAVFVEDRIQTDNGDGTPETMLTLDGAERCARTLLAMVEAAR